MKEKIKQLIKSKCIVILDTNVFLNIYEYSPNVAEFFIDTLYYIEEKIRIPSLVKREFEKNHRKCHGRQKKKFQNIPFAIKKLTDSTRDKISNQLKIFEKLQFPETDDLNDICIEKLNDIDEAFDDYVEMHDMDQFINEKFLKEDKVKVLFNKICSNGSLLSKPSLDDVYKICEEGEIRYAKKIPPGYKDEDKAGIHKFHDLIIWKEVIAYCKEKKYNLIFVTDDGKVDWFQKDKNNLETFHGELIKEFIKYTSQEIVGIKSIDLFSILSEIYSIKIPNVIESALKHNVADYIKNLQENYEFEDHLVSELVYSNHKYVDIETLSSYDGSYFEMSEELNETRIISYNFEGCRENEAIYLLTVFVNVTARSNEYWGKDNDTKEIILSDYDNIHVLEGELELRVSRVIDFFLEDMFNDTTISSLQIVSGELEEIEKYTSDDLCKQCNSRRGTVPFYNEGYVCSMCATGDDYGNICPMCGMKIPHEYMNGSVCQICYQKYDAV